jgi:hypothetical protein
MDIDVTLYWILRSVVKAGKSYALRWIDFAGDLTLPELFDRCHEGFCVECEWCSTTTERFGGIGKSSQFFLGVMEPVLQQARLA